MEKTFTYLYVMPSGWILDIGQYQCGIELSKHAAANRQLITTEREPKWNKTKTKSW